jgi:hypothetical protein
MPVHISISLQSYACRSRVHFPPFPSGRRLSPATAGSVHIAFRLPEYPGSAGAS